MLEINANAGVDTVVQLDSGHPSLSGQLRIDGGGGFRMRVMVTDGDPVSVQSVDGLGEPVGDRKIIDKDNQAVVSSRSTVTTLGRSGLRVERITERGYDNRIVPEPIDVKPPTVTIKTGGEIVTRDATVPAGSSPEAALTLDRTNVDGGATGPLG